MKHVVKMMRIKKSGEREWREGVARGVVFEVLF